MHFLRNVGIASALLIGCVEAFAPLSHRTATNHGIGNVNQRSISSTIIVSDRPSMALGLGVDFGIKNLLQKPPKFDETTDYDVVVVGAGCAGVGTALMLSRTFKLDHSRILVVEQAGEIGDSFRNWPEEMRFISPSFNQYGWTKSFDLNAIHYETAPSHMLATEHPSGEEYAMYLESIVRQEKMNVRFDTKVTSVEDVGTDKEKRNSAGPFHIGVKGTKNDDDEEKISTRYVVWAAGEFQHPREKHVAATTTEDADNKPTTTKPSLFPGADLCVHNSRIDSWKKLDGDDFIVIGGYESGIDAAYNLAKAGKKCKVIASTPTWSIKTGDPSSELAPYTAARLRDVLAVGFKPSPVLLSPLEVIAVNKIEDSEEGGYGVASRRKDTGKVEVLRTPQPPILATGFTGSVKAQASHLFDFSPDDAKGCIGNGPILKRGNDESTKVPGVFLVGPTVSHGELSFCFVYKFRQRFAVVANSICTGLGMDTKAAVAECRAADMYLDDFKGCECGDVC